MLTAKYPIVINEDSKISIITINDKEINCDFYGSVKDGEEIECEYDEENKKKAEGSGCQAYLTKPLNKKLVVEKLQELNLIS